ncbi:MAG: undecaprenyldiphospho-muramoylpentapeptide beta-N-acetylglucosaminyltransferase [Gemmatimonadota bacterium]|jgi:UDP-N-acetylglucosamine--N-acetylmuramyl-(pentapeptide) pyrophosphoryl-undecaprenol N-acetylglucosamine transferase|nr:undecaprenyldiphospho-muramoylpentapeptide beta-N-acetylglucosaminyltransferase [Gemmatimonadota bacterium]
MSRPPRVLFAGGGTGGHLYPALALASAFQALPGGAEIFFLGAKRGVEARVLPERGVPHELLPFEPIRRSRVWTNWRLVPALFSAFSGIRRVFREFRPDLVVGTGGYASGPVVAWGIMRGVPTAIQEQNSYPGITTRLLASRVRQIFLAFPEARALLKMGSRTKVFEMGNPIAPPDRSINREEARRRFGLGEGPVVLVVGGSQGARLVNEALLRDLTEVVESGRTRPEGLSILWATGPANHAAVAAGVERLGIGDWVRAEPYINDMPKALAVADLAISRSGAMMLAELCAWGVPGILVPFPHAAANHQFHNARALADAGAAVLVPETELTTGRLWNEMVSLVSDSSRRAGLAARAAERGHPDAARQIVERMVTLTGSPAGEESR